MIDVDNLFNLFPFDGDDDEVYISLTEKPMYKLGMYKKLVLNFLTFKKKVITFTTRCFVHKKIMIDGESEVFFP